MIVKMASNLVFGKEDGLSSIKESLKEVKKAEILEFDDCPVASKEWQDIVALLSEDVVSFTGHHISISDSSIKSLVSRCRKIENLKLVDCMDLSERCMKSIGVSLAQLKSIHFEYKGGSLWPANVDVLSVLVKNCLSELYYVAFVGFDSVTDVGVCYSVECFNYLQVLNLSYCSQISDRGVIGVVDQCSYLKEIRLRGTRISDNSLRQIARKAKRLLRVDFSDCCEITCVGIQELVETLGQDLQEVSLGGCLQLGDSTLSDVLSNCPSLKHLDFSGTSLTQVPPHILALRRLQVTLFHNCTRLIKAPAAMAQLHSTTASWHDFLTAYKQYNIPYRLRIFFLGDSGSGKTSWIQCLMKNQKHAYKHHSGADVYYWQPLLNKSRQEGVTKRSKKAEESHLMFEIYDIPEDKVCLAALSVLFTSESLYVIVFNSGQSRMEQTIQRHVTLIQSKAAGSRIMAMETTSKGGGNSLAKNEALTTAQDAEKQNVKQIRKEIEFLRHLVCDLKVSNRCDELQALLQLRPSLSSGVLVVDNKAAEDNKEPEEASFSPLSEFVDTLISEGLNYKHFRHLGRALKVETIEVLSEVYKLLEQNVLIIKWDDLVELLKERKGGQMSLSALKDVIGLLHNVGYLLELYFLDPFTTQQENHKSHYLCINPPLFAHCLTLLHPEGHVGKRKPVDIKPLWPKKKSRPDPGVLLAALEDVSEKGLIRESILPIILQNLSLSEDQIRLLIDVLIRLGLLHAVHIKEDNVISSGSRPPAPTGTAYTMMSPEADTDCHTIQLPHYPGLAYHTCYRIALSDIKYSVRPHIHWSVKPHPGDIQVSWKYEFPCGKPMGLYKRLLSLCYYTAVQATASYIHPWTSGVLCRIGEAFVFIEEDSKQLIVRGRTLADERGQERLAVQYLWAQLAPILHVAEQYLLSWNGLFYRISLEALGTALHRGVVIVKEPVLSLLQCIDLSQKQQQYTFLDDDMERYLDIPLLLPFDFSQFYDIFGWISHLVENRGTITAIFDDDDEDDALAFTSSPVIMYKQEKLPSAMMSSVSGNATNVNKVRIKKSVRFDLTNLPSSRSSLKGQSDGGYSVQNHPTKALHVKPANSSDSKDTDSKEVNASNSGQSADSKKGIVVYRNLEGSTYWRKLHFVCKVRKAFLYSSTKGTQTQCTSGSCSDHQSAGLHRAAAAVVAEVLTKSILRHLKGLEMDKEEVHQQVYKDKAGNGSVATSNRNGKQETVDPINSGSNDPHHKQKYSEKLHKSRTCALL